MSPIKNPGFILTKNAAHIMETAARIIEPGPQAITRAKMPLVGSSSVHVKFCDFKEKAEAAHDDVKLWDLRKLKNFRSFELYDQNTPTNSMDFDHSGSYLAIASSDIRVYQVGSVKAEWNCKVLGSGINGSQPPYIGPS